MTTPHAPAERGSAAAPAVVTTAEVRAHDRTVRYRRSGSTGPALLLLATDSPRDLWPELPELLSELFRLVIPELGVADTNPVASLRGMLEGLGFDAVPVIAAGRYCDAALGLALDGNESVGRMILVPEPSAELDDLIAGAAPGATARTAPIHVLSRELDAKEALARVLEILG